MKHQITLMPSDRKVSAMSQETILDSLLSAGLAVKYNCSNGSCGACKARLLDGSIGKEQHHDYHFKEQEKEQGYFLMCQCHPGSDMTIEAEVFRGVNDLPEQHIDTKVTRLESPADNFKVIEVKTPRSKTLQFFAGQHVQLDIPGLPPRRKSIASCPCDGRHLQFHFHRQDDEFSDYIFDQLQNRTSVGITGPYGSFTFDEQSKRPIILVASDVGFAPIKSLIEHIIALEVRQPMHLFWCVDKEGDDYLSNYCRSWLNTEDNFIYNKVSLEMLGVSDGLSSEHAQQMISKQITDIYPDLSQHDLYLSGPADKYHTLTLLLMNCRASPERLFIDELKRY